MSPDEVVDIIVSLKETTDETDFNRLLAQLGVLIDYSGDTGNEKALREAVGVCEHLVSHNILSEHRSLLFYFCANAWSHLRRLTDTVSGTWEKPSSVECENELLNLRRAIREESFSKLSINERCQILTNLGNVFSYVGRFVESIDYWNMALDLDAGFSMALGNRGYGLTHYAGVLYDDGHRNLFMKSAYADLNKALTGDIHKGARQAFREYRDWIEQVLGADYVKEPIDFGEFSLGDTEEEVRYRNWCIDHRLFLNPLNDILKESVVSHDCLTTPSIVVALNEGPYYPGFYNQLKQEYVSARFLFYEGLSAEATHFSDRGVLLYNTLDYPSYSVATEKMKAAFRIAYSLLDKIAYFLNKYLRLEIPERSVYFRSIWYEDGNKHKGVRETFTTLKNWPLVGLFWLSKDLYENRADFKETIEPSAQAMYEVRNHVEHKYLKLHDSMWSGPMTEDDEVRAGLTDSLAYSMYRTDFEEKTLKIIKITRAALIYLSLAICVEEKRRESEKSGEGLIANMVLDVWEDEWKC